MKGRVIALETNIRVDGITASEIFDFLANPTDLAYQRWWPGVHLRLHVLERGEEHVGDVIYMDEYVGRRRVRMKAVVLDAVPPKTLVWQFEKGVRLPVRLSLELADEGVGVKIRHRIEAGYAGLGRLLDPLWRLPFSRSFARDLDDHVRREFPLLRDRLDEIKAAEAQYA